MRKFQIALVFLIAINSMGCNGSAITMDPSETPTLAPATNSPTFVAELPTHIPTPTSTPKVQLSNGDISLFNGDYELARQLYQKAFSASNNDEQVRESALWGLGRVEYLSGNYDQSLVYIHQLITDFPDSEHTKHGYFLLGQTYDALQRYSEATNSYSEYLSSNPGVIDTYIQEFRGDSLNNSGNYSEALTAYQASLNSQRIGETFQLEIKIAKMITAIGDIATSVAIYKDISTRSSNDYLKAQMDFLIGQTYLAQGQADQAYPYFLDTVSKYPLSYDSYSALVALVDAGVPVDDFERGLVDYFAGQYGVALAAFNRYQINYPDHDGTVLHFIALILRENGEYQQAVDNWTRMINNYPDNRYWDSAWDERAYTLWGYMDDYSGAVESLLDFTINFPTHSNAPYYLNSAARILERDGQLESASSTWQQLAVDYSTSELVPDALFNAGISLYRSGAYDRALTIFQKNLIFSNLLTDQSRAYLWIGKTQQAMGDDNSAQRSFQLSAGLDPTGYYSERARNLILGIPNFEPPVAFNLTYDIATERSEAEAWIRITFNLPPETDLSGVETLVTDGRFVRGTELWELGLFDKARLEFEDLRMTVAENPIDSYRLTNYLVEIGLYRVAIESTRQLLRLAGLQTYTQMLTAPRFFIHINYGSYFKDLVVPYANEFKIDPLFLFSVITQESSFEGFIYSTAGARGLMQIIPSTGKSISDNLGWPLNYTSDDLYRPYVNLRLGTSYLASNISYFEGDLYATLAAYNAGPGNASIWKELSGNDPDLFLEVIRYSETRDYIRHIFEIYIVYRSTYGSNP
ncbi:MAG: tetratricopeptide repeat protein [Chloroflexota bacterium]